MMDGFGKTLSGVRLMKRAALVAVLAITSMLGLTVQADAAPTRFYLQNGTAAITNPTIRGTWNLSTTTTVIPMARTKLGTVGSRGVAETNATNNYSVLLLRAVSEPIIAKTIPAGSTLNWAIGALESATAANMKFRVHAYVVSNDGATLRGTLLANDNDGGTEWPTTTAVGRIPLAAKTLTAVTTQANDRVIIEVGYYAANTSTTSYTGTLSYGGTAGDMTNGGANTLTGWFEFSEDLFCASNAPTDLVAPSVAYNSVNLTWTPDLVNNDLGYDVYRNGVKINASPILGGSYTDTTVAANTTYNTPGYQVMGLASCGNSALSTGLPVTTPPIVNSTTVGTLSYSNVGMASMTVTASYSGDDNNNNTCSIIYSTSATYSPYSTATATRVGKSWVADIIGLNMTTLYYVRATFNDTDAPAITNVNVDGSKSTTANLLLHNSANIGTTYGTWGAAFTCATCHLAGTGNIKRIATTINAAGQPYNGRSVAASDASVYGANNTTHSTSTQICEVCHSQPSVHKYNQTATNHYNNNCTQCHKHKSSFKPPTCVDCHDADAFGLGAPIVNASSPHVKANGVTFGDCTDCHTGHYSATGGVNIANPSAPYATALGLNYGHGGIKLGGPGTVASISAKTTEAEICWGCHDTVGVSEWGANTQASTGNSPYNYGNVTSSNWTTATWSSSRSQYAYKSGAIQSTHTANPTVTDAALTGAAYGYTETKNAVADIRCTFCHDVHELARATGDTAVGKPYLRGSWRGNPYEEDGAPRLSYTGTDVAFTSVYFGNVNTWGGVPRGSIAQNKLGGYWIDQNNVVPMTALTTGNGTAARNPTSAWTVDQFGGICALCHGGNDASWAATEVDGIDQKTTEGLWIGTNGHANSVKGGTGAASANSANVFTARNADISTYTTHNPRQHYSEQVDPGDSGNYGFRSSDGLMYQPQLNAGGGSPHMTATDEWVVDETGATKENQYHKFSCSKCHNPHASRLPKLMITNCLDTVHNTWDNQFQMVSVTSTQNQNREVAQWTTAQNCHRYSESNNTTTTVPEYRASRTASPAGAGAGWNKVTPWKQTANVP